MWQFLTFLYEGFNSREHSLNKCLTIRAKWSCQNGEMKQQNDASCQQKARTFVRAFILSIYLEENYLLLSLDKRRSISRYSHIRVTSSPKEAYHSKYLGAP